MSFMFFRRQLITLSFTFNSQIRSYSSRATRACQEATKFFIDDSKPPPAANADFCGGVFHLSPLYKDNKASLNDCRIELVDNDTWRVSSGLADSWRGSGNVISEKVPSFSEEDEIDYGANNYTRLNNEDPDFDEIEDMRIHGNLFYKLDKDSKEYEEYAFEFHRRNKNKNNGNDSPKEKEQSSSVLASRVEKSLKSTDEKRVYKKEKLRHNSSSEERSMIDDMNNFQLHEFAAATTKKLRTPTFNQLTDPYHEPFCLDIFISKGSARASIIHRATSKVVAVAHSISKDMKFDFGSPKNRAACAAVGEILAQRALDDDIHNVVYTPRKGDKLEGKLDIVLQSIISNGINVKVKIKQRNNRKASFPRSA